jgi:NAD(P)-dependent dehydrogenase (short-subunit alcohol dehydrogenase family)
MNNLAGKVALVAGATRGAGRGIALGLAERGATVYCAGRSTRGQLASGRPETIDETAELVTSRGGTGIAVRADLTIEDDVVALVDRIRRDHGRLDILVNDVWGGEKLTEFGVPFWQLQMDKAHTLLERAIFSHLLMSRHAVPLMLESGGHFIAEITDGNGFHYRGNLIYDLVKTSIIRIAFGMGWELRRKNIAVVAVTPGFLRSEEMLEHFGVTEETWRDAGEKDEHFLSSETPLYVGRAIAALASDTNVMKKTGRVFSSWDLSDEYGFTDVDGSRPHWGRHWQESFGAPLVTCDDKFYEYCWAPAMEYVMPDWP